LVLEAQLWQYQVGRALSEVPLLVWYRGERHLTGKHRYVLNETEKKNLQLHSITLTTLKPLA
jgi:hypothetical protein